MCEYVLYKLQCSWTLKPTNITAQRERKQSVCVNWECHWEQKPKIMVGETRTNTLYTYSVYSVYIEQQKLKNIIQNE